MTLKTLKDFETMGGDYDGRSFPKHCIFAYTEELRNEAKKWILEDIKIANKQESGVCSKMIVQVMKWAKRFDIDIKELAERMRGS